MATMQGEVFEAFRELGVSEDKALRAATALAGRDDDVGSLKRDVNLTRWMVTFNLGLTLLMLGKLFLAPGH